MTALVCQHFTAGRCRSCRLLEFSPAEAREKQLSSLQELLKFRVELNPPVWCRAPAGSRIRGRLAVAGTIEEPVFGFFNDQQQVIPAADCPLHHPLLTAITGWLADFVKAARLEPYSAESDRGELKFVVLTASPSSGKLMVQWVLRSQEAVDRIRSVWRRLSAVERSGVSVMSAGIQPRRSTQMICDVDLPISEERSLRVDYPQPRLSLLVPAGGFVQTNYEIAGELYAAARVRLEALRPRKVLDLYCGSGGFSFIAAECGAEVLGVDVSAASVACADALAREQSLRAEFLHCAAGASDVENRAGRVDVVICNPPRAGLEESAISLVQQLAPECLLYSSCNPVTLQRDLNRLGDMYEVVWVQPFDMFPGTTHWEVLCEARLRSPEKIGSDFS
jgi:23S rRNA (uracil747-C5)-methyltransferase